MAQGQAGESTVTIPLQFNDAHWRSIFDKYDVDGNGKISYRELKNMIRGSANTRDLPDRVVKIIMHRADLDDSGYLEYPEFIAMIHRKDMQGVFGHFVQRYVTNMVPQRPTSMDSIKISKYAKSSDLPDGIYEDEYSCNPPAVAMIIMSILEIMVFLYDAYYEKSFSLDGPATKLFVYDPNKRHEIWRYFTYMFVHVNVFHLLVNLAVQIMLGIPLEMVHRWWRVLIIYILGVLAGSLGTSVSDPQVYLAGASGGVYALITAHVATIIMNWSQMEFAPLQLLVFLVITCVDVGQAVYTRYVTQKQNQIGYVAHLAGAVAGLLVGINILRNLEVKTWEKSVWWASFILYTALMLAAIVLNVFYPDYFAQ